MEENTNYLKIEVDEFKNLLMFKIGFNLLLETLDLNYDDELTIIDRNDVVKILKSISPLSVKRKKEELLKNKECEKSEE